MKMYGEVDEQIHVFSILALDGGEWLASHPGHFTPRVSYPSIYWKGGCVGPRIGLEDVRREKFCPYRYSNSDLTVVQSSASRYTDCVILAHNYR
jgi:hypothetical protein